MNNLQKYFVKVWSNALISNESTTIIPALTKEIKKIHLSKFPKSKIKEIKEENEKYWIISWK